MKEHPILFSGPMVRAILAGRKTQTRREVKPQPSYIIDPQCRTYEPALVDRHGEMYPGPEVFGFYNEEHGWKCPYGQPGDRLWVRETTCIAPKNFATPDETCVRDYDGALRFVSYRADGHSEDAMRDYRLKWTPSIHVPRWASRITLEIVSVRVERLSEITEADAIAEGIEKSDRGYLDYHWEQKRGASLARGWFSDPVLSYRSLWETIDGPGSWDANPWVWVVEFKRVETQTA